MQAGNRAPRSLDQSIATIGKHQRGTMEFVLHARGKNPDHALMPVGTVQAEAVVALDLQAGEDDIGLFTHAGLDLAPLPVEQIQFARQGQRGSFAIAEQAGNALRHIVEPPSRIESRPQRETKVETARLGKSASGRGKQRHDARAGPTGTHALESLFDQNTVVGIEFDHVSHRAQRHQIQPLRQVWLLALGKSATLAQFGPQRHQHVEHHADASQILGRKTAPRLVRIHDQRIGQTIARQMVIGDQHIQPQSSCHRHALDTGNAVIDRQQQIGATRGGQLHDLRRQAVTVLEAVGHQKVNACAKHAKAAHTQSGGRCTIGIVITDDQDALLARNRICQPDRGGFNVFH